MPTRTPQPSPHVRVKGTANNELTPQERQDGWLLLFDGKTLNGWVTSYQKPSKRPVEDGSLNPHRCGG